MRKRKRFKNDYEIRGDVAVIYLERRDGGRLECLIDTEDLEKFKEFPYKWYPWFNRTTYYARSNIYLGNGKNGGVYLHRWLLNPPSNLQIDHINHNGLDNRKVNLRLVTIAQNCQNRSGAYRTNKTSGIRGITWRSDRKKWEAQITLNYRTYHIGRFETLEEAEKAVIKARAELMPFSYLDSQEKFLEKYRGGKVYENCNTYF